MDCTVHFHYCITLPIIRTVLKNVHRTVNFITVLIFLQGSIQQLRGQEGGEGGLAKKSTHVHPGGGGGGVSWSPRDKKLKEIYTGCKSDIWKKVQLKICHIYTPCNETNYTSAKSPWFQLSFDTLKVTAAQKWCPRDLIEDKMSKTLHVHKIQKNMLSAASGHGALLIMPRPLLGCLIKLRSRAFGWCIICFCTSNGSFRVLKRARVFFFIIFIIFRKSWK